MTECTGRSALHSLRPGGGFNRSSKLKVRAVRACASPDTDGLRIPSRANSVRCGASARAVDKRCVSGSRAATARPRGDRTATPRRKPPRGRSVLVASTNTLFFDDIDTL